MQFPLPEERIDEDALRAWRVAGWIQTAVYAAVVILLLALILYFDWPLWIVIGPAVLAAAASWLCVAVVPRVRMARWRYAIRENEIDLLYGLIVRKRTLIPMAKIQHVDTKQGPILRRYGLSTVTFSTAGGNHEIPALSEAKAAEVQARISRLAGIIDEEL